MQWSLLRLQKRQGLHYPDLWCFLTQQVKSSSVMQNRGKQEFFQWSLPSNCGNTLLHQESGKKHPSKISLWRKKRGTWTQVCWTNRFHAAMFVFSHRSQIWLSSVRNVPYSQSQTMSKYSKWLAKSKTLPLRTWTWTLIFLLSVEY